MTNLSHYYLRRAEFLYISLNVVRLLAMDDMELLTFIPQGKFEIPQIPYALLIFHREFEKFNSL